MNTAKVTLVVFLLTAFIYLITVIIIIYIHKESKLEEPLRPFINSKSYIN